MLRLIVRFTFAGIPLLHWILSLVVRNAKMDGIKYDIRFRFDRPVRRSLNLFGSYNVPLNYTIYLSAYYCYVSFDMKG